MELSGTGIKLQTGDAEKLKNVPTTMDTRVRGKQQSRKLVTMLVSIQTQPQQATELDDE